MFSKISEYLRPYAVSKDPQQVQVPRDRKNRDQNGTGDTGTAESDDMLFSIDAIRALLTSMELNAEQAAELDDILKGLETLDAQGIKNIPVRLGQSIYEAVRFAVGALPRG